MGADSGLILPGQADAREVPIVVCDGCGCLVSTALLAAHDRTCGAKR